MRLFGFEITRGRPKMATAVNSIGGGGWFPIIREAFAGAWQSNATYESPRDLLTYSAIFSAMTLIATDLAKLRVKVMKRGKDGIGDEVVDEQNRVVRLLRTPNRYQSGSDFIETWAYSRLSRGNCYVLKVRERPRGEPVELHVLDPSKCIPLIAENGDVYYELGVDDLSGVRERVTVPSSEIIHDRWNTIFHPLVGVSPLVACALSASVAMQAQKNQARFFKNASQPGGVLSAPGFISDETAARLKREWEENYSGENAGRIAVAGEGLQFNRFSMTAEEAQLYEQLKLGTEDVARVFHVPLYKIGGAVPPNTTVEALNQGYYSECLQGHLERIENRLDSGLELPDGTYTEFDLDDLLRMDKSARYKAHTDAVAGGWLAPDEVRRAEGRRPVPGGGTPYMQQQNYSLAALAKRDESADPFGKGGTQAPTAAKARSQAEIDGETLKSLAEAVKRGLDAANAT